MKITIENLTQHELHRISHALQKAQPEAALVPNDLAATLKAACARGLKLEEELASAVGALDKEQKRTLVLELQLVTVTKERDGHKATRDASVAEVYELNQQLAALKQELAKAHDAATELRNQRDQLQNELYQLKPPMPAQVEWHSLDITSPTYGKPIVVGNDSFERRVIDTGIVHPDDIRNLMMAGYKKWRYQ